LSTKILLTFHRYHIGVFSFWSIVRRLDIYFETIIGLSKSVILNNDWDIILFFIYFIWIVLVDYVKVKFVNLGKRSVHAIYIKPYQALLWWQIMILCRGTILSCQHVIWSFCARCFLIWKSFSLKTILGKTLWLAFLFSIWSLIHRVYRSWFNV